MRILPSRSRIVALISPTRSLKRTATSFRPAMISLRVSRTQSGQRESVCRGQPSGGFVFCQDFRSGRSDHLGVNAALGRNRFARLNTNHTALAAIERAFSKYFVAAGIKKLARHTLSKALRWRYIIPVFAGRIARDEG